MNLKEKFSKRIPTVGTWMTVAHRAFVEIAANAKIDWICIDLEHSVIDLDQMSTLFSIANSKGVDVLVRVSANDPVQIKRAMDAGAKGLIVPMVNSAADALKAYGAMHYPPRGYRGVGLSTAQGYGALFDEYKNWLEKDSILIVQIEHIEAVRNLDEILSLKEIDGFFVGPYDLSASLGVPGVFENSAFKAALKEIEDVQKRHNKVRGFHVVEPDPAKLKQAVLSGYDFIAYSLETRIYDVEMRKMIKTFQELK